VTALFSSQFTQFWTEGQDTDTDGLKRNNLQIEKQLESDKAKIICDQIWNSAFFCSFLCFKLSVFHLRCLFVK